MEPSKAFSYSCEKPPAGITTDETTSMRTKVIVLDKFGGAVMSWIPSQLLELGLQYPDEPNDATVVFVRAAVKLKLNGKVHAISCQ